MSDAELLVVGGDGIARCWWGASTPDYVVYHDTEWGFPVADDHRLLEKLCLEGFQSGLSWLTILRKRPDFRRVFHGFDPAKVAAMGEADVARLLDDASIVRHRGKIEATIGNARASLEVVEDVGSLAALVWSFEPEDRSPSAEPSTPESAALSRELKRRGFRFVGPTTVYAFMQAMGMVNDHVEGCDVRPVVDRARGEFERPTPIRAPGSRG
jgi:DNA-3-methyladenine glycosylase I